MSLALDKHTLFDEAPYLKINTCTAQLINLSHLETAIETIVTLLHNHETQLTRHASDIRSMTVVETRASHHAQMIQDLENRLRKKDQEIAEINKQLQVTQDTENFLRQRLEKVEQDFNYFKASRDIRDHEVGELRVQIRMLDDKSDVTEKTVHKLMADMDGMRVTQQWLQDGQLAGRIIRLEKDITSKVEYSRFSSELEMRDKLRKELTDLAEHSARRVDRHEQLVERISKEVLSKASVSELKQVESKIEGKAEKEHIYDLRRSFKFLEEDHKKKLAMLEEKKVDRSSTKAVEGRVAAAENEMKNVKDAFKLVQDSVSKVTGSLASFASDSKLQAVMKAIHELDQKDVQSEIRALQSRIDEKADKDALKYLFDVVNNIFFEETNGVIASRVQYRCLMCNRFTPSVKEAHVCKPDEPIRSLSPGQLNESSQTSKQFSIVGHDGKLYRVVYLESRAVIAPSLLVSLKIDHVDK
eukprot:TRINITY_DN3308_c0_g2_i5.p1 TRINITY_DN3308_c0_g2~~TRINITY_DN3308_c0_g2_i5.p1  ORF type:complete len:471 (-),score=94.45 TRINITY_DN3308_c0_g2_i5:520-1932(-)